MYFQKVKNFITKPVESFRNEANVPLNEAFKYLLILGLFNTVMGIIVYVISIYLVSLQMFVGASQALTIISIGYLFFQSYVGIVSGAVLGGAFLHLFAWLLGARQGIKQTLKSVIYANTPSYVLGWVPGIIFITFIWTFVLNIVGLMNLQKMSTGRAILAVILPILIALIIIIMIIGSVLFALDVFNPTTFISTG